jgi:hypothetical protein
MKKIVIALLMLIAAPVMAADYWKMTGVMAVYSGPFGSPYSAPIVNETRYESEKLCDAAINQIAQSHPRYTAINSEGVMLPVSKATNGWVAVAAACIKQSE